jgi:hypothetical protein
VLEAAVEVAVVDVEEGRHDVGAMDLCHSRYPLESSPPITQPVRVREIVEVEAQQQQQQQQVNVSDRVATFYDEYTSEEQEAIVYDYISKKLKQNKTKSKSRSNLWDIKSKNNQPHNSDAKNPDMYEYHNNRS